MHAMGLQSRRLGSLLIDLPHIVGSSKKPRSSSLKPKLLALAAGLLIVACFSWELASELAKPTSDDRNTGLPPSAAAQAPLHPLAAAAAAQASLQWNERLHRMYGMLPELGALAQAAYDGAWVYSPAVRRGCCCLSASPQGRLPPAAAATPNAALQPFSTPFTPASHVRCMTTPSASPWQLLCHAISRAWPSSPPS